MAGKTDAESNGNIKSKSKPTDRHQTAIRLFGRWDASDVAVSDIGLKPYINLKPVIIPKVFGRHAGKQFHKSHQNIIERLANKLIITGHRSKKHVLTSGKFGGKTGRALNIIRKVLERLERETKKNPIQVVVVAVENAALLEEITSYQLGGIMVRKAVITSPQRRIDWALRLICQAAYRKSFNNKKNIVDAMSDEILACYQKNSQASSAIRERERIEREAEGAR